MLVALWMWTLWAWDSITEVWIPDICVWTVQMWNRIQKIKTCE